MESRSPSGVLTPARFTVDLPTAYRWIQPYLLRGRRLRREPRSRL
jgi:hypothetical protein